MEAVFPETFMEAGLPFMEAGLPFMEAYVAAVYRRNAIPRSAVVYGGSAAVFAAGRGRGRVHGAVWQGGGRAHPARRPLCEHAPPAPAVYGGIADINGGITDIYGGVDAIYGRVSAMDGGHAMPCSCWSAKVQAVRTQYSYSHSDLAASLQRLPTFFFFFFPTAVLTLANRRRRA
eukprot:2419282-Rhodomonas_salina.3